MTLSDFPPTFQCHWVTIDALDVGLLCVCSLRAICLR